LRLDGKTALVTGCKSGIGQALALGCAEAGADIIGVSRTLKKSGSETERMVSSLGRKFTAYECDFSKREDIYRFIKQVKSDFPVIDILFSNAATSIFGDMATYPDESWDRVIEVNLNSHFILSREFGRDMLERGSGKIIFTASICSFIGSGKTASYAASKGGIVQLAQSLANSWASRGVNVNAIAPGWVDTDMTQWVTQDPAELGSTIQRIPANRIGMPEDLKGVAVFLASKASDWVHGTVITVDGGQLALR
jgi:2-dehydro-3-deoxy-D-gluconate 5-dehydrogenase